MASTPFKTYRALITQTGTDAPVATVLANNTGKTMTWAYSAVGIYTLTAGAVAFTANKTAVEVSGPLSGLQSLSYANTSTTVITFTSGVLTAGAIVDTDAIVTNILIEVKIFE